MKTIVFFFVPMWDGRWQGVFAPATAKPSRLEGPKQKAEALPFWTWFIENPRGC
jgi:hypothetical protein